jgi:hypothetical protein
MKQKCEEGKNVETIHNLFYYIHSKLKFLITNAIDNMSTQINQYKLLSKFILLHKVQSPHVHNPHIEDTHYQPCSY